MRTNFALPNDLSFPNILSSGEGDFGDDETKRNGPTAFDDTLEWEEVIGTICGDDTCLLICGNEDSQKAIRDRIFNLI